MFTVYNEADGVVQRTVSARTSEIAYRKAEAICERNPALVFDDTCDHGTAYSLCGGDHQ